MLCKIETIDNNLRALIDLLYALAAHAANGVFISEECLMFLASTICDTQKLSEEALNEATSNAKKKKEKDGEAA